MVLKPHRPRRGCGLTRSDRRFGLSDVVREWRDHRRSDLTQPGTGEVRNDRLPFSRCVSCIGNLSRTQNQANHVPRARAKRWHRVPNSQGSVKRREENLPAEVAGFGWWPYPFCKGGLTTNRRGGACQDTCGALRVARIRTGDGTVAVPRV